MKKTTKKATETKRISKEELSDYVDRKLEDVTVGELLSYLDTAAPAKSCNSQPLKNLKDKLDKFLGEKR